MSIKLAVVLAVAVAIIGGVSANSNVQENIQVNHDDSCSSPPASLEVCLSSIFNSIEQSLVSISASLKKHKSSLHWQMHYEEYCISNQISAVSKAKHIAKSVKQVIDYDYYALEEQYEALYEEKVQIKYVLYKLVAQFNMLEAEEESISEEIIAIYNEYETVKKAHWSMNEQISAIGQAKAVIDKEETDIDAVIQELNIEISRIYGKLEQMNKRQIWLESWEVKLSVDLSDFNKEVKEFKEVQYDLIKRVKSLKIEQKSLFNDLTYIEQKMEQLSVHYNRIAEYLYDLEDYYKYLYLHEKTVISEGFVISGAFSQFSCMDELLEAEACNSKAPANNKPANNNANNNGKAAATTAKPAAQAATGKANGQAATAKPAGGAKMIA